MASRLPSDDERAFIDTVLGHTFEGAEALRTQWAHALVESSCDCGCGSIRFVFDADFAPVASTAGNPLPVEAEILDASGDAVGGIIVLVSDGVLDDVDVHAFGSGPLAFPTMATIRWRS